MTQKKEEPTKPAEQVSQNQKQQTAQDQPVTLQASKGNRTLKLAMLSENAPKTESEEE